MTDVGARVVAWLSANPNIGLGADAVPGVSAVELGRLAALGGFASPVVYPSGRKAIAGWPPAIMDWITAPTPPIELSTVLRRAALRDSETLAGLYEQLVSGPNRRRLGTFFTPPALVQHMAATAERSFGGIPARVVDPGAGVGAFTIAAAANWGSSVAAVDVNPVTLGLLGVACELAGLSVGDTAGHGKMRRKQRVDLVHDDYIRWIGPHLRDDRRGTLIIGNPPYTRHQSLTNSAKQASFDEAGDLVTSSLAGLSTYFLAVTLRHVGPSDGVVLLLPSNWLATRYAKEVRAHLWAVMNRPVELHVFPSELQVFPGTQVAATVLAVGPRQSRPAPFVVSVAHLKDGAVELSESVQVDRVGDPPKDFTQFHRPVPSPGRSRARSGMLLGDIAVIRRGVATGANAYYFLTDDQVEQYPNDAVVPGIIKARALTDELLSKNVHDRLGKAGERRWLLDFHEYRTCPRSRLPASLKRFIKVLENEGIDERHLLAVRRPIWWVPEKVQPADLLFAPMTKGAFKVIGNGVGAVHSNTLYGVTLNDPYTARTERLAKWLRTTAGQTALTGVARTHSTGLLKVEPGGLRALRVPVSVLTG